MNSLTKLWALAVLAQALTAQAHDTWFEPQRDGAQGTWQLAMGTGNRFPLFDQGVDVKFLSQSGCRNGEGETRAFELLAYTERATLLRSPWGEDPHQTCWAQLQPFEFVLPPDKIAVYFKEIRPSEAVLSAWVALKARGLPFVERYTKSARFDGPQAAATPTGTTMDVLRQPTLGPLTVGDEAGFQVLREGQPLADFPVELVNERSKLGLWLRTDAQGRVRTRLPLPGHWLLRGTDLRLSTADATKWESQFITYAFEVR